MNAEVFTRLPNDLKTIEIDVEKRKFLVNGESFGRSLNFTLTLNTTNGYEAELKVGTNVEFRSYTKSGKLKTAR